ncbi:unnamed protein product [Rhizophagus irregularis]|nr:unnamed protein product [Rhizophagus irregularis]
MSTSEQTSEQYPGYEIISSYLKERENCQENWSYYGFLLFHHDAIITSSFSNKWKKLNNFWMSSFLKEARKLIINQEIYNTIEEKKDSVKRKLEEEEKENLNPRSKKSRSTITLFCMVEIPDEHYDELVNLQLHENNELLATKKISKYFTKDPADEHIHIIVSLPETANKVAKSIYEFNIIVNPKRTKAFNWVANIEQVTLKDLKETIFSLYQFPELEKNGATLAFSCNDKKYSPQINLEFQNMLQLFVLKRNFKFTVFIETSLSFSSWTFPKVCQLYKLSEDSDPSLSVFSLFNCEFVNLDDEKSQAIIKHLMTDLNFRFKAIPIGNEASKSQYVCSYLVAIANLFENKFKICPEKNVSGLNGHGPVDFALIQVQTSRIIGITEVKDRDFQQGVAQNAVQCESALSNNKKKVFEEAQKLDELEDKN